MKILKLFFIINLIIPFAYSAECDSSEPPIIKYTHNQIDNYLFTKVDVSPYNSGGEWIDYCFKNSLIVTDSFGNNKSLLWFEREFLHHDSWKYIASFKGSFSVNNKSSGENYSVYELGSGGTIGSSINVFMTFPKFKSVFNSFVTLEEINEKGIVVSEKNFNEESLKGCLDSLSNATWPHNKVEYVFGNGEFYKRIIKEGGCIE
ncbi:hypothetical protein N9J68_03170 [Gammaproteobacteria bacterium]|nr:hypothetical protein [Gammaproteobacteria bacterium]MDA9011226.1 hypothetical protein [Gammaproteobacteria bacterium]MDA9118141.1 hypothetical protein [Gammaproteobacteria bacterium]